MKAPPPRDRKLQRHCSVCGNLTGKRILEQHFEALSGSHMFRGYDVVVCTACGFGFADGIPDQTALDAYYRDMSKYDHHKAASLESEYELARLREVAGIITQFVSGKESAILDVGCGTGTLLHMLNQAGYGNVLGLDPSPASAEVAHTLYKLPVLTGTLSNYPKRCKPFECIILLGVLEHIRDLRSGLRCLRELLADDGLLYVCVPDSSRFSKGDNAPFQEFSVEHINFFSPVSLENLMRVGGFGKKYCRQSIARVNCRTTAPIIHAVYQKRQTNPKPAYIVDVETETGLKDYIARSSQVDVQIHQLIDGLVAANKPVIVWGAGAHTLRLLAISRLPEARIRAFVDSNPKYQGKNLIGIPIIAPIELKERSEAILISSWVFQREMMIQIRNELNLQNELILLYHS
jgi:SAM-dependent methyltransferase